MTQIEMVSTLGFPIVACMGMSIFIVKVMIRLLDNLDKFTETIVILTDRIEKIEEKLK